MLSYLPYLLSVFVAFQPSPSETLDGVSANPIRSEECAEPILRTRLYRQAPAKWRLQRQLDFLAAQAVKKGANPQKMADFTLPVVFHIVHQNGPENITDAQVLQAFDNLNDAYANVNFYGGNDGVDTKIQFCLARRDPNGNATTGINRVVSPLTDVSFATDDAMKDLIRWNPLEYINIWLVRSIEGGAFAGYAYLPASHGEDEDGIVMVGSIMPTLGGGHSTLVHEMGHYLGLYHTFEGSCSNFDCLMNGDQVCDTPPDATTAPPGDCSAVINSCTTDAQSGFTTDQNDINWNYVDYGNHPCRNGYTQGQADRMAFFIENIRQSLLGSPACSDPCLSPIIANFTTGNNTVNIGSLVNFTNTTTGGTSFKWLVNGNQFATTTNASYTFSSLGSFEITLDATNGDPNCASTFSTTIEVVCPISASFTTSNLYPSPGATVNFTNASTGANGYAWSVNGQPAGSSQNFSYTFSTAGQYNICLSATNGLCAAQFCQLVFAIEGSGGSGCDGSFIKTFGDAGVTELVHAFLTLPDGNLLLGGRRGNSSLLMKVTPGGDVLWSKAMNLTSGDDFIFEMMLDSDGKLVATGRDELNTTTITYIFKFDLQNQSIIWTKLLPFTYSRLETILEKSVGGNYILLGMVDDNNMFLEVNRNDGSLVTQKQFNFGQTDFFLTGKIHNGFIYTAGLQRNGDLGDIRASITKLNLSGVEQWTRFYFNSLTQIGRTYFYENLIENDTLVAYGRGDLTGSSFTDGEILLMKANINGGFLWAKRYNIPSSNTEFSGSFIPLPDGYILQGNHLLNSNGESEFFIIRVNKQGNLIWAKSIKSVAGDWGKYAIFQNGFIYFSGRTDELDNAGDVLLGKMSLDGEVVGPGCSTVTDLVVTVNNVTNNYDGQHPLAEINSNLALTNFNLAPSNVTLPNVYLPGCECIENPVIDTCSNGLPLHTMPDAVLSSIVGGCNGGTVSLTTVICNADSVTLPANTPISFYLGNPTTTAATLLTTELVPNPILPGVCLEFNGPLAIPTNQLIYAVINDNGTTPTPFNLNTNFPNTPTEECDFTNNITSFTVSNMPPVLNLGPDQSNCHFEATVLDAGPGFISYQWFDGSTAPTFTASQPGIYTVTVTDQCGGTQTDAVTLSTNPSTVVDIGFDLVQICQGETYSFTVDGFASYQWFPADLVDCPTCATVTVSPDVDTCLMVVATDGEGCYSADTVCVEITIDTAFVYQNKKICLGDTLVFNGMVLTQPGVYQSVDNSGSCIKVTSLTLGIFDSPTVDFQTKTACIALLNGAATATASGTIPPYSYAWQNGLSTTHEIVGVDAGNYSVTVTDGNGCTVAALATVPIAQRPNVESQVTPVTCFGVNDGTLTIVADDPNLLFSFQGATPNPQTFYDSLWGGGDQYLVLDTFGCEWVQFFLVDAPNKIVLQMPNSIEAPMCDSVQLSATANTSPLTWSWNPPDFLSCTDCPDPIASPFTTMTYYLMATDSNGCKALDSIVVRVDFDGKAYIPNAFSPNDDGINDVFYVLGNCVSKVILLRVFDRWGEMVFEKSNTPPNDPLYGWDGKFKGKPVNSDVFVFYITIELKDGSTRIYKGDVTLLR